ncbi:hypothetical protein ACSSS7_002650 [Eimeria intestinalis]
MKRRQIASQYCKELLLTERKVNYCACHRVLGERCPGNMRLRAAKGSCCALVGLCMQQLHWLPLCLLVGTAVVASETGFLGSWNSSAEVSSGTVGGGAVAARRTSTDLEDTGLRGLLLTSDVTDEGTAGAENIQIEHNTENAGKYPRSLASAQEPSASSRAFRGLCVSTVLALCLGFLALRWKRPPFLQAAGESHVQQTGTVDENLSKRLKALRELAPVAEELGRAVDTAEASELLEAFHACVQNKGEEEDSTKLEMSIENALSALRRLQRAATEEVGYLLQKDFDNLKSVTTLLQEWEEAPLGEEKAEEMSPFIMALTSSQDHFMHVSKLMQEIYEGLKQAPPIVDEHDLHSLRYTADGVDFVVKLQHERGNAAMLAAEQRIRAEAAMRMTLSRGTIQGFRQRWGEYEIAHAYLSIAREGRGAAGAEGQSAAGLQGHLDEAELRLAKYEAELKQLMDHTRSTSHDTILNTLTRNNTLEQEQESLRASLEKHWELFIERVKMPEKLEESGRESVKMVLMQALQRISQDRDMMYEAITSTLSRMAQVFADTGLSIQAASTESEVHDIFARSMLEEMVNVSSNGKGRLGMVQSELQLVDQEEDTNAAAKMMEDAVASAVLSSAELTAVRLSQLRIELLISVERTAKRTMEEATKVFEELKSSSSSSNLEPTEMEILLDSVSELEYLIAQACWAARNAGALEDRIDAAGRMQEVALSLRHLSYLLKDDTSIP